MKRFLTFAATLAVVTFFSSVAFASDGAADNHFTMYAFFAIGAGFGIGIAAFGGALGQGRAATAALEGIARNPGASGKLFTPLILSLALVESLVIFALVICFLIVNNINLALLPVVN